MTVTAPEAGIPRSERTVYWFSRHWLAVFNVITLIYVGLPFTAPALMKAGLTGPGQAIYTMYFPLCHQFGFRSWFLFGEQPAYERPLFETLTGIDTSTAAGQVQAKLFAGNERMGYKVAFCQRDVAIYAGLLLGGLIFGLLRKRARAIHWLVWLVLGVGPIALDGFSQLFSQVPALFGMANPLWQAGQAYWRESTPFLRTLTGGLFGFMLVWLSYPYIEDAMLDNVQQLRRKWGWR